MTFTSFKFKDANYKVVELNHTVVCTATIEEAKSIINSRRRNGLRYSQIAKVVNRDGEVVYS